LSDIFPPSKQRERLLEFQAAIDARQSSLRRDECGDWHIAGFNRGENGLCGIYAVPEGFLLVYVPRYGVTDWDGAGPHIQDYHAAKRKLWFCRLTQDGTGEGIFLLDRLPSESEAEAIRSAFGIRRKKQLSQETLEALKSRGFSAQRARKTTVQEPITVKDSLPGTIIAEGTDEAAHAAVYVQEAAHT
jgi:hypothetical protein